MPTEEVIDATHTITKVPPGEPIDDVLVMQRIKHEVALHLLQYFGQFHAATVP